jgi:hypothetical protein
MFTSVWVRIIALKIKEGGLTPHPQLNFQSPEILQNLQPPLSLPPPKCITLIK